MPTLIAERMSLHPVNLMGSPLAVQFTMIAAGAPIAAQAPETFEVASLKQSRPGSRMSSTLDAAQFNCTAHSLMHLIVSAYPDIEVQPWKVSGGPAQSLPSRHSSHRQLSPTDLVGDYSFSIMASDALKVNGFTCTLLTILCTVFAMRESEHKPS